MSYEPVHISNGKILQFFELNEVKLDLNGGNKQEKKREKEKFYSDQGIKFISPE